MVTFPKQYTKKVELQYYEIWNPANSQRERESKGLNIYYLIIWNPGRN